MMMWFSWPFISTSRQTDIQGCSKSLWTELKNHPVVMRKGFFCYWVLMDCFACRPSLMSYKSKDTFIVKLHNFTWRVQIIHYAPLCFRWNKFLVNKNVLIMMKKTATASIVSFLLHFAKSLNGITFEQKLFSWWKVDTT